MKTMCTKSFSNATGLMACRWWLLHPRVQAMLDYAGLPAGTVVGAVPQRHREVTAEKAAINAVMAGCRPEYFPVVIAALSAMLDPAFNANTALSSTGGAAMCLIVSGPLVTEIGFAAQHNVLGVGSRPNATIGRSLRLVAMNVLGARSPGMDGSSIGNPGKFTMTLAEDMPPPSWPMLRTELGYNDEQSSVTIIATEGVRQIANHLNGDPVGILRTIAAALTCPSVYIAGKGGQAVVVVGYEHRSILADAGWSKAAIRDWLVEHTRISPEHLTDAGVLLEVDAQHDMTPGADGRIPTIRNADDLLLVPAGGAGAGWSACIPAWAPDIHSRYCSRRVMPPGAGLPEH